MTDSTEIERRLVKLLHPLEGIERGLDVSPRDPDSKDDCSRARPGRSGR